MQAYHLRPKIYKNGTLRPNLSFLYVSSHWLQISPSPQPSPARGEGVESISSPLMGED